MIKFAINLGLLAKERDLKSKRVHNIELFENHYSGCGLLALFHSEMTVGETKDVVFLAAH